MCNDSNIHLQISILAHDVDTIGFIVDKRLSVMQPLNYRKWLGKNVARYVASLASPSVYLSYVTAWKSRTNCKPHNSNV